MDDETRYWIAQEVAATKEGHDARGFFHEAKEIAGKILGTMITYGLGSYKEAYSNEFYTIRKPRTKHINAIKLSGDMNNNKMERMNGEIRDREKVMRGLKKDDTPILTPGEDGEKIAYKNWTNAATIIILALVVIVQFFYPSQELR